MFVLSYLQLGVCWGSGQTKGKKKNENTKQLQLLPMIPEPTQPTSCISQVPKKGKEIVF